MIVKIGNTMGTTTHLVDEKNFAMIYLTDQDKKNIANMPDEANIYACYAVGGIVTPELISQEAESLKVCGKTLYVEKSE